MQDKWKVLQADSLISEDQCNEQERAGWELRQIVPMGGTFYFYFRRIERPN